jgi:hypothetical protein
MIAKTLSGDLVYLEAKSEEEFKAMYLRRFVKEKFQPFVRVNLFNVEDEWCVSLNTYTVLPELESYINWQTLSLNPAAIHLLERNLDKVDWYFLSRNPAAIPLLERNVDKIEWEALCHNQSPGAYELLRKHPERIHWMYVARSSPFAYKLMNEFLPTEWEDDLIEAILQNQYCETSWIPPPLLTRNGLTWAYISRHPNLIEIVIEIMKKFPERICWKYLSQNPSAIEILKQNHDKIQWDYLVANRHPEAIELFLLHQKKRIPWSELSLNSAAIPFLSQHTSELSSLCWNRLCVFPEAIELLEANAHKITDWYNLLLNRDAGNLIRTHLQEFNRDELFMHPCVVCPPLDDF